jgi:hypothetical protein
MPSDLDFSRNLALDPSDRGIQLTKGQQRPMPVQRPSRIDRARRRIELPRFVALHATRGSLDGAVKGHMSPNHYRA